MFNAYGDEVEFFIVYIREAHALDSRSPTSFTDSNDKLIEDPIDSGERSLVASQCVADLNLPMPALLDGMDDAVSKAYMGHPDRLFLVGRDGKIAYCGGHGPFFFSTDGLDAAIARELASPAEATASRPSKGR